MDTKFNIFHKMIELAPIAGLIFGIYYFIYLKNPTTFVGSAYAYSCLDSCCVRAGALCNDEKYALKFSEYYKTGQLVLPNFTTSSNFRVTYIDFNEKVEIIRYSDDSSYAEIRFYNPRKGPSQEQYKYGFVPINLIHNTPAKNHCQ